MAPPTRRLSRHARPDELSPEEWQRGLRRQFGAEQPFLLENVGAHAVFSDFSVTNPRSSRTYRVAIRGEEPGVSYCSCPDFATNDLGTCKHIEFTLATLRQRRGGKRTLRAGYQPVHSSLAVVYGTRRRLRLRLAESAPAELHRLAAELFDPDGFLAPPAFPRLPAFLRAASSLPHQLRFYEDALAFARLVIDDQRRRKTLADIFPNGPDSEAFEGLLPSPLPSYQREGALFACRAGRAILADEMGLGKTVQAIAAAEIGARHLGVERVLVVCPASLKHQWLDEICRFSTRTAEVVGGGRGARERSYASPSFFKVMGYDTVHVDRELIAAWSPHLVILDEAQRIKNWGTRSARSVKRIDSPMALVLTGTPLENRIEELVSIVEFADRHRLGPTWRLLEEHQIREEGGSRVVGYRGLDRLGATLEPILLRRRKADVLGQLPGRSVKRLFVEMTPEQARHHEENREIAARLAAKWRRFKHLSEADQKRLTIALQRMRMSCDSTYLLDGKTDFGTKADEVATLLSDLMETAGTKAVVFSQWIRMLELAEERLSLRGLGSVTFHGGVETARRGDLVRRFRDDPACRVFLSTDAGGTGLNLQRASVVVNLDLPWNPAVLEQRIGRVHRLGQSRPVQVFDFVAEGTIEEGMLSLLGFKRSLFAGILDSGDPDVHLGGTRLSKFMETVEAVTARPERKPSPVPALTAAARALPPAREIPAVSLPPSLPDAAASPAPGEAGSPAPASVAREDAAPQPVAFDPNPALASLLSEGARLLAQLAAAVSAPVSASGEGPRGPIVVERDAGTGAAVLRIRLDGDSPLERLVAALVGTPGAGGG